MATSPTDNPLAEHQAMLAQFQTVLPDLLKGIFSARQGQVDANTRAATSTLNAGVAAADSTIAAGEITAIQNEHLTQLMKATGYDINDPDSLLSQEIARETQLRNQREQILGRVSDLQGVSFFQNPIGFFMAQPELQRLIPQHNKLAVLENTSSEKIVSLGNLTTQVQARTPAKISDVIRKKAVSDAIAVANVYTVAAEKLLGDNAGIQAQALLDQNTIEGNLFGRMIQLTSTEEQVRARREAHADAQTELGERRVERAAAETDRERRWQAEFGLRTDAEARRKAAEAQDMTIATVMSLHSTFLTGKATVFTKDDVKALPPEQRAMWAGIATRNNYGNDYRTSVPLLQAISNMGSVGGISAQEPELLVNVRNIEAAARKKAEEEAGKAANFGQRPSKADLAVMYEKALYDLHQLHRSQSLKNSDKTNLGVESPHGLDFDFIALDKTLPPPIRKILDTAQAREPYKRMNELMTAKKLLSEVVGRVLAGELEPKQAAVDLSSTIEKHMAVNYSSSALQYLGLAPTVDYLVRVGPEGRTQVDISNSVRLENYLMSIVPRRRTQEPLIPPPVETNRAARGTRGPQ